MNVSKLNPVGYEAKSEKGNTYKKSNIWKTAAIGEIALDVFALSRKSDWAFDTPMFKASKNLIKLFDKIFKTKTMHNASKPVITAVWAGLSVLWLAAGILVDRYCSENNRKKADGESISSPLEQVQHGATKIDTFINGCI